MMVAFKQLSGARVLAVASEAKDRAESFAKRFGLSKIYGSVDELLADQAIDAIYIANATENHAKITLLALKAGKAVLCEKPIGISEIEGQQIEAEASRSGMLCMEAMWTLFLPAYRRLLALQQENDLGLPMHLYADFGYPANKDFYPRLFAPMPGSGVLLDRGVYPIALALKVFGSVIQVTGIVNRTDEGVDSHAGLQLLHSNGSLSQIAVSIDALLQNRAVLSAPGGAISLEPPVIGTETVKISRAFVETKPFFLESAGLKANLKQSLRQCPLFRRINRYKNSGAVEFHPFGVNQYLPLLNHFCELYRAGKSESDIYPLNLSTQVLRIVDQAKSL
jgi:predicted dehydrogenase